jgi:hypothetical protein
MATIEMDHWEKIWWATMVAAFSAITFMGFFFKDI